MTDTTSESRGHAADSTVVAVRPLLSLDAGQIEEWKRLARFAAEPNPFQEPQFILSLVEHGIVPPPSLLTVIDSETGRWLGASVLESCPPTFTRPLPHLRALTSRYSFLDSPLIHRDHLARAIRSAVDFLRLQRTWHGVRFRLMKSQGAQAAEWSSQVQALDVSIDRDKRWSRALTRLPLPTGESLLDRCSRSRRKSLLRARRWLESAGKLSHRLVTPEPGDRRASERFLHLESLGWKGTNRTAIGSSDSDAAFFCAMIERFAIDGRILFGELLCGDRVIASTCNLIAGDTLFAFKLGWHPECARGNPGHWAEIELAAAVSSDCPELSKIDSCAQPGSYVESVANDSQPMESGVYVWSRRASALCELRRRFRWIRSAWGPKLPWTRQSADDQ